MQLSKFFHRKETVMKHARHTVNLHRYSTNMCTQQDADK